MSETASIWPHTIARNNLRIETSMPFSDQIDQPQSQHRGVLELLGFRVSRRTSRRMTDASRKVTVKRPAQPRYDRYFRSNMALTVRAMMLTRTHTMQTPSNIVAIFSLMDVILAFKARNTHTPKDGFWVYRTYQDSRSCF